MSRVNLKIIFVKKQKQTREHPTQGQGATFICSGALAREKRAAEHLG